ncbi:DUF4760 domain-containing protein [Gluconacetobacter sp.]|uniref:DUF4760 domain-containing protein n=1 Tax=Gluconacetobacter sp. TaxID=1935994 RepID=UPI0039E7FEC6
MEDRKKILSEFISGKLDIKTRYNLNDTEYFNYKYVSNKILDDGSRILNNFNCREKEKIKVASRKISYFSYITIFLLVIFFGVDCFFIVEKLQTSCSLTDCTPFITVAAAIIAGIMAAIGWLISSNVSHRNSQIQHTINLIGTRFSNAEFSKHLAKINQKFGNEAHPIITMSCIETAQASPDEKDRESVQSVKYILNYFEFIAICVFSGEINYDFVKSSLRGNLLYYYNKFQPYIREIRINKPSALQNYIKLVSYMTDA